MTTNLIARTFGIFFIIQFLVIQKNFGQSTQQERTKEAQKNQATDQTNQNYDRNKSKPVTTPPAVKSQNVSSPQATSVNSSSNKSSNSSNSNTSGLKTFTLPYMHAPMDFYAQGTGQTGNRIKYDGEIINDNKAEVVFGAVRNVNGDYDIYRVTAELYSLWTTKGSLIKTVPFKEVTPLLQIPYSSSTTTDELLTALERYLGGEISFKDRFNKMVELDKQDKLKNSRFELIKALPHTRVLFLSAPSTNGFMYGQKLNIWGPDSIYILNSDRYNSEKIWDVWMVSLKASQTFPLGNPFMSIPESELKPKNITVPWNMEQYTLAAEKKINKRLGKRSVDEELAKIQAKHDAEKRKIEQDKQAAVNGMKTNRKKSGLLIKTAPYHSWVPFYRGDFDESVRYLSDYRGYKLSINAKDSVFILTEFAENFHVLLVDQKKNPGNDEGTFFGEAGVRRLSGIVPVNQNELLYQEDIIAEIEKQIYKEIGKPVPANLQNGNKYRDIRNLPINKWGTNFYDWYKSYTKNYLAYDKLYPNPFQYQFGSEKRLNKFKKEYSQKEHLDFQYSSNRYTGDFIGTGEKKGLGILMNDDSGYIFKGKFVEDEKWKNGVMYNRDKSMTIFQGQEKFTIKNDGTILIRPGVLRKVQKGICITPDKLIRYYETDASSKELKYYAFADNLVSRTAGAVELTLSEDFKFILYNNGDICLYSIYGYSPSVIVKKSGDVYIGQYENEKINSLEGLYISTEGYIYEGIMIDGKIDVYGQYLDEKKQENYIGPFKNGKRHGFGKIYTIDALNREDMIIKNVVYNDGILK